MLRIANYPLLPLALFALPLLGCILLMNNASPPNEKAREPYTSVVIAMEFVSDEGEVFDTLDPLLKEEIEGLDRLNYIDFAFMAVYSLFLGLFIQQYSAATGLPSLRPFGWVAVFVFLADLLENVMMLKITGLYLAERADFSPYINFLPVFTWAKWAALALTFAKIGIHFIQNRTFSKVLAIVLFVPAILMVLALAHHREWITRFTTSVFLGFICLLVFSTGYKRPATTN